MALSKTESLLLEAIKSMLADKNQIGLAIHSNSINDQSNTLQALQESIQEQFDLYTLDSTFNESLTAAFRKVHAYKYITDPLFNGAILREFKSLAIPEKDQQMAFKAIEKIINEIKDKKSDKYNERDAGWHPDLEEVLNTSKIEQYK